ncbi:MAG: DNA methyltransferase [Chitinivibrionales bacterium]
MNYHEFIKTKAIRNTMHGKDISLSDINPSLFPFQKDIVRWAIKKGRCALFLDTGLGKTHCQTEWARLIAKRSLIIAPLSVARQTVRLAKKITNTEIHYTRDGKDVVEGINITNYEMVDKFNPEDFQAVVLDESSILKSLDGKTKQLVISMFEKTPYRLCCTATPAPNDESEIGNHAEFLGIMKNNEMLATFFIHANKITEIEFKNGNGDYETIKKKQSGKNGQEWRLRNYARETYYHWMSTWSMSIKTPSNLGYDDRGYVLPKLSIIPSFVNVDYQPPGQLFFTKLKGIADRANIRRTTFEDRIETVLDLVNGNNEQWILWCGLNNESKGLKEKIDGAVEICGEDSLEFKTEMIENFQDKKYRVMITKPKIAGFGMNFQNACNMVFVGLNDSWETFYQCIRREWRFGQDKPVNVYIVLTNLERQIYDNVMAKEKMAERMTSELISRVKKYEELEIKNMETVKIEKPKQTITKGENYTAYLGDSCEILREIKSESIDVSVYSPPFADLFTYSASEFDLGNCRNWDEFFEHYAFIIREILRVTKSGRVSCVHTSDIAAMAMKDGYIGLRDFPGAVIKAHEKEGWIYHGYAVVTKNPQAQAIRTHAKGLLFVQMKKDSSCSRPCILDRILFFKKKGDSAVPITPVKNGEIDNEKWIDWAGGIWTGISESDTLQFTTARAKDDEKHICPLQLGTIERCIKLYSNPKETLLTPFMGIGSEAYQALLYGRKAIGIELKESYYNIAVKNLADAELKTKENTLFSFENKYEDARVETEETAKQCTTAAAQNSVEQ